MPVHGEERWRGHPPIKGSHPSPIPLARDLSTAPTQRHRVEMSPLPGRSPCLHGKECLRDRELKVWQGASRRLHIAAVSR